MKAEGQRRPARQPGLALREGRQPRQEANPPAPMAGDHERDHRRDDERAHGGADRHRRGSPAGRLVSGCLRKKYDAPHPPKLPVRLLRLFPPGKKTN
jgi:hypothetical protein